MEGRKGLGFVPLGIGTKYLEMVYGNGIASQDQSPFSVHSDIARKELLQSCPKLHDHFGRMFSISRIAAAQSLSFECIHELVDTSVSGLCGAATCIEPTNSKA